MFEHDTSLFNSCHISIEMNKSAARDREKKKKNNGKTGERDRFVIATMFY